ncbi:HlyD family efflux transporter periplasmic adaptor subunit [Lacrimispora saccharolytica]|nr:HlyD family efflux transporter periplasmic adaptor subunit [Lacrimispora saccharolytica]
MKKKGAVQKYTSLFLAATVTTMQVTGTWKVYAADTLEYTGTTEISTVEVYPLADTSAVELEVEEVYAEEGTQLTEGDPILKLTDESYQEAWAYYEAAIIKAESTVTDTQLEYDQGVLEAKYTCETAEADAENAEYIRTYQTDEVESALTDHEETLNDIDERIAELEAGIADGSYDSGSASGGASAGGSSASGSGQKKSDDTQKQSEAKSETESSTESDQTGETESGSTGAGQQGETESGSTEAGQPGSDGNGGSTDGSRPESTESGQDAADADISGKTTEELRQELTTKMSEAETLAQTLTEKLKSAMEQVNTDAMDSDTYSVYTEQLKNVVKQLEADIESQKKVESILKDYDFSSEDANQATLSASITGDENVLSSLKEIQEKMAKYQTLISSVMSLWSTDNSTALVDDEILTEMSDYLSKQAEINELSVTLLEKYESTIQELKSAGTNESAANSGMSGSTTENGDKNGNTAGAGNSVMPGSATGGAGNASGGTGESSQVAESAGSTIQGSGVTGQNGQSALSDEDISLLGDTYDLTSVKQLLSREPSDSSDAQDLIEELQDSRETTKVQYEELQRKKKIFELEIQHTYDSAVIAGKLAKLTYQQELSDWEETLAEAKQNKADLETQKALLEAMTDGVISADRDGTAASISYEAEDLLDSSIPIVSYYDTDTVSITLEVSQEEIASLSVGDTAEVTLAGAGRLEGTLTEKSVEPEDGTSRTTVNYTATVSLDNSDGRLSDGLSATVTFTQETEAVINE